jgi:hypothetical protein
VTHSMCDASARWCARADAIFAAAGMHVLDVGDDPDGRLIVTVESDQIETGCPSCGAMAASQAAEPGCSTMRRAWGGSRWCGG